MWKIDENGNVVWVEGATRADVSGGEKVLGFLNPGSALAQEILGSRAAGGGGFFAPPAEAIQEAIEERSVPVVTPPLGSPGLREPEHLTRPPASSTPPAPLDLSGIFTDTPPSGYSPSLVNTSAAESLLRYEQTPEEQAALDQLLQDLDFRAEAGTTAVRTGFQDVQRINAAAADRAARMAREAGPEAARMWIDAANTVLTLSAQAADVLGSTAGMQSVNVSPTAGSGRIAALLAAEAPRAQALAERMGMATSEQIASQARTAGMMGEAFAGEIQRTSLIQANNARQAHNAQVFARISEERQLGAQMRFNAAQTNAQLLSTAAAAAAAGATSPSQRRDQVRNLVSDVREFANIDPLEGEPRNGIAALMGIYGLDANTARGLIMGARKGTIDWDTAMAEIEG